LKFPHTPVLIPDHQLNFKNMYGQAFLYFRKCFNLFSMYQSFCSVQIIILITACFSIHFPEIRFSVKIQTVYIHSYVYASPP